MAIPVKVLITGATGMLARDLIPVLQADYHVVPFSRGDADITSREQVRHAIADSSPDVVVNCAAYTKVDTAEEEREKALLVNGIGVQNLALVCREKGIPLCHISSDYVFNGEKRRPYTPFDNTDPINAYGESKLAGEKYLQWITDKFYIVRTSWLYGKGGSNFVATILRLAQEQPEIRVVEDQRGSPTCTVTLSHAIRKLVATGAYGIYHVTDETRGGISWFEFAQEILSCSGVPVRTVPIPTTEFPRPARRPRYSVLETWSFSQVTGFVLPYWKDVLKEYLGAA